MNATLFAELPTRPVPLRPDEAALLASLPVWETVQQIMDDEEAACRRLEKRGLVKVHRWKGDPIAIRPTMYAGRIA